jgi:two-component system sensor histidine kinase ChvG
MAWDTDTKRNSPVAWRDRLGDWWTSVRGLAPRAAASRLAQLILTANFIALGVLVFGMLALSETRRSLVNAELDSLRTLGELIANVLAEGASESVPAPTLRGDYARLLLRQLYIPEDTRALVYDREGRLVADSHLLADVVETFDLAPPGEAQVSIAENARDLPARALDAFAALFLSAEERAALNRSAREEVQMALDGKLVAGVRRDEDGRRIVSVSLSIEPVRAVIGVVMLESYDLDALISAERRALSPFILIAALVTAMSSLLLTVSIARPIRRLAKAARKARRAGGARVTMPDLSRRRDEIGELGVALSEMTEALYDRMDAIERFAADVAHELKNPLTSIRSAAEILPSAKDEERRDRLLAVIAADVGRLDRLISDISRASRVDAELAREDVERLDLGGLLRELVEAYQAAREGEASGPTLRFETPLRNPFLIGRDGPLGQVFRNLIDNALTFSPEDGEVSVRLYRGTLDGENALIATIEDQGPGIPEDNLETVFERFYTERPKGAAFGAHSGLGLAISRQIIDAHGGRIRAENRHGTEGEVIGARFTVQLPAAPVG